MINLIPKQEKKKMLMDFYIRVLSLFFVMLGTSFLFASVLLLPSYFVSYVEENFISSKLKIQESEPIPQPNQNTLATIKDLKFKLNLIENIKNNKNIFSQRIINEILLEKTPNIKITEIFYQKDKNKGETINISGIAPNREVLLSFRRALEDNVAFSKVDLPVSNFVKGTDIKFNLSLIPS